MNTGPLNEICGKARVSRYPVVVPESPANGKWSTGPAVPGRNGLSAGAARILV